jgi:Ca-activated chloride channel family protein
MHAINNLHAGGSTNGQAGLQKAYEIARSCYIEGGNNRIIMASDGDLNVGIRDPEQLKAFVEEKRESGIYLSVLGFGSGNFRDDNMETLADHGNGVYYYIDGEVEAEKIFGSELCSTLTTVANDVKLQLTFDPAYVEQYRLIGYENRRLNDEDFEDDSKDAGEVGAGHTLTVCYEITMTDNKVAPEAGYATLAVRWKNPGESESVLREYGIGDESVRDTLNDDALFAAAIIETAMLLHNSRYKGNASLENVLALLGDMQEKDCYQAEFEQLIREPQGRR